MSDSLNIKFSNIMFTITINRGLFGSSSCSVTVSTLDAISAIAGLSCGLSFPTRINSEAIAINNPQFINN